MELLEIKKTFYLANDLTEIFRSETKKIECQAWRLFCRKIVRITKHTEIVRAVVGLA